MLTSLHLDEGEATGYCPKNWQVREEDTSERLGEVCKESFLSNDGGAGAGQFDSVSVCLSDHACIRGWGKCLRKRR